VIVAGAGSPDKAIGTPSSSSSSGHGSPTKVPGSAASRVDARYRTGWLGLAFCVVLGLVNGR